MTEVYYKFIDFRKHWSITHKLSSKNNSSWVIKSDSPLHPTTMMLCMFITGNNANLKKEKYKALLSDAVLPNEEWEEERQCFLAWYEDLRAWISEYLEDADITLPPLFPDAPGEYCPFASTTFWPEHPIGTYNYMPGSDGPFYGPVPDYAQCTPVVSMPGFYRGTDKTIRSKADLKTLIVRGAPVTPDYDSIGTSLGRSFNDIFSGKNRE